MRAEMIQAVEFALTVSSAIHSFALATHSSYMVAVTCHTID